MTNEQTPPKATVEVERLINKHACSQYRHEANEPGFDCDMVEFQKPDFLILLDEYTAPLQTLLTEKDERIKEMEAELSKVVNLKNNYKDLVEAANQRTIDNSENYEKQIGDLQAENARLNQYIVQLQDTADGSNYELHLAKAENARLIEAGRNNTPEVFLHNKWRAIDADEIEYFKSLGHEVRTY